MVIHKRPKLNKTSKTKKVKPTKKVSKTDGKDAKYYQDKKLKIQEQITKRATFNKKDQEKIKRIDKKLKNIS